MVIVNNTVNERWANAFVLYYKENLVKARETPEILGMENGDILVGKFATVDTAKKVMEKE